MNVLLKKILIFGLIASKLIDLILTVLNEKLGFFSNFSSIDGIATILNKLLYYTSFLLTFIAVKKMITDKKIDFNKPLLLVIQYFIISQVFVNLSILFSIDFSFISFYFERPILLVIFLCSKIFLFILISYYFIFNAIKINNENKSVTTLSKRMVNFSVDKIIVITLVYSNYKILISFNHGFIFEDISILNSNPYWYFGMHFFIYYFVLEFLFLQTIGKIITNTFVSFENTKLRAIFIRTICRFIPFEAFSFFGKKGWHDSLSKSSVID